MTDYVQFQYLQEKQDSFQISCIVGKKIKCLDIHLRRKYDNTTTNGGTMRYSDDVRNYLRNKEIFGNTKMFSVEGCERPKTEYIE